MKKLKIYSFLATFAFTGLAIWIVVLTKRIERNRRSVATMHSAIL